MSLLFCLASAAQEGGQEAAIAALNELGARVIRLKRGNDYDPGISVSFEQTEISELHLDAINRLPNIDGLYVYGCRGSERLLAQMKYTSNVTSICVIGELRRAGTRNLARFPNMEALVLRHNVHLMDEDMEYLGKLQNLKHLDLTYAPITHDGAVKLEPLTQLEQLSLRDTRIKSETMRMLASFPKLRVLDVQYTLVMDGGLADLHKLPALQILSVSWTSDVGLTSIAQCKGLTALDFSLSKITDKGLAELSNMPALTSLDIQSNMITKSAVEDFRRSHPNVRVLVAPVYDSSVPQSLWRTYDLLKRLGYFGYNFETHTPTYFQRKWVFEAYCEFRDFTTEDRWYGMLGPTAILNHACRQDRMELVHLATEGLRAGFWGKPPPGYETVVEQCRGKAFLNFDDDTFADPPQ